MENESNLELLQIMASQYDAAVLYIPAKNEIDYRDTSFPIQIPAENILVPQDRNSNPFECADSCIARFGERKVFVLIPGTSFDAHGTRHGKGGGWYDRFLSKIPASWLRVGIIDGEGFSDSILQRQPWDEPVHWVLVRDGDTWRVFRAN